MGWAGEGSQSAQIISIHMTMANALSKYHSCYLTLPLLVNPGISIISHSFFPQLMTWGNQKLPRTVKCRIYESKERYYQALQITCKSFCRLIHIPYSRQTRCMYYQILHIAGAWQIPCCIPAHEIPSCATGIVRKAVHQVNTMSKYGKFVARLYI